MPENKSDLLPGTLNLMILKTLAALGRLHGYGVARRIEQTSGDLLRLNQGTIYPARKELSEAEDTQPEEPIARRVTETSRLIHLRPCKYRIVCAAQKQAFIRS